MGFVWALRGRVGSAREQLNRERSARATNCASGAPRAVQRQIPRPARSSLVRCDTAPRLCASGSIGQVWRRPCHSAMPLWTRSAAALPNTRGLCSLSHISCGTAVTRPASKGEGDQLLAITLTAHSCEKACSFRNRWALIVPRWSARCSKRYDSGCRRPCYTQSWTVPPLLNTCRRLRVPSAAMCRACVLVIGCAIAPRGHCWCDQRRPEVG